jgi:hypothetical protein
MTYFKVGQPGLPVKSANYQFHPFQLFQPFQGHESMATSMTVETVETDFLAGHGGMLIYC